MKDTSKMRLKLLGNELQLVQIDARARKQAAAVLEVLAGLRTPQQAADELGISLPTYFNLEIRAMRGLTFACCAQPPGRQQTLAPKLRQAQSRLAELEQQMGRYQALLRTAQRSAGLAPPVPPKRPAGARRAPRKPSVRAMRTITALRQAQPASDESPAMAASAASAVGAEAG